MIPLGLMALSGVLLCGLAVPLAVRKVPRNRFYGFRTPATLADEALWRDVNAAAGVDLLVMGLGLLAVAGAGYAGWIDQRSVVLGAVAVTTVGGLWSVVHGASIIARRRVVR